MAPLEKVVILGCGVTTGYGAALNSAKVREGSSVGIWGLGAVGLGAVMGAKAAGAKTIVGIDISPKNFPIALKLGATEVINPTSLSLTQPFPVYLTERYNGGFDYTVECAGDVKAMQEAFNSVHDAWGVACIVGGSSTEVSADPLSLLCGRVWKGSMFGGWILSNDVPKLVEKYLEGKIMLDDLITHHFELGAIDQAFGVLRAGAGIRSVIKMCC